MTHVRHFPDTQERLFFFWSPAAPQTTSTLAMLKRRANEICRGNSDVSTTCRLESSDGLKPVWRTSITHFKYVRSKNFRQEVKWISWRRRKKKSQLLRSGTYLLSRRPLKRGVFSKVATGPSQHKGRLEDPTPPPPPTPDVFTQERRERWFFGRRSQLIFLPLHHTSYLGTPTPAPSLHSGIISEANRCLLSHLSTLDWMYS